MVCEFASATGKTEGPGPLRALELCVLCESDTRSAIPMFFDEKGRAWHWECARAALCMVDQEDWR